MNILFISAVLPFPLYSGGQIRVYNLLKQLSARHRITLLSFIRDEKEKELVAHLSFCHGVHTILRGHAWQIRYVVSSLVGTYPFLFSTYNNEQMREKIAQELAKTQYDLVHIEPGYVWPSLPDVTVPLVIAEHNIEHTIYEGYVRHFFFAPLRPFLYRDVMKLYHWEKIIWRRANCVVAVSQKDAGVIEREAGKKVFVVANGVDISKYRYKERAGKKTDAPRLLFVGNFSWLQNRDAVRYVLVDVLPKIKTVYPKARMRIVGKNMPPDLRKMVAQTDSDLRQDVDEISAEYEKADVLFAPIRVGGGTKYKILEAMAAGLPVITTSSGATGLGVQHKRELYMADDAYGLVGALKEVLENPAATRQMTKRARELVERKYTWSHIARELENAWRRVV